MCLLLHPGCSFDHVARGLASTVNSLIRVSRRAVRGSVGTYARAGRRRYSHAHFSCAEFSYSPLPKRGVRFSRWHHRVAVRRGGGLQRMLHRAVRYRKIAGNGAGSLRVLGPPTTFVSARNQSVLGPGRPRSSRPRLTGCRGGGRPIGPLMVSRRWVWAGNVTSHLDSAHITAQHYSEVLCSSRLDIPGSAKACAWHPQGGKWRYPERTPFHPWRRWGCPTSRDGPCLLHRGASLGIDWIVLFDLYEHVQPRPHTHTQPNDHTQQGWGAPCAVCVLCRRARCSHSRVTRCTKHA